MQKFESSKSLVGLKRILIFYLVLICPGCVYISHQKYPETHKFMPAKGSQCINIEGTYNNTNFPVEDKRLFKNKETISLAAELGLTDQIVKKVKIIQADPNALEVSVLDVHNVILSKKQYFRKTDYQCKNGRIIFKYKYPDMSGLMGVSFYNSNHIEVTKTFQSDLVLGYFNGGFIVNVIPPIPLLGSESVLYFFKKIE